MLGDECRILQLTHSSADAHETNVGRRYKHCTTIVLGSVANNPDRARIERSSSGNRRNSGNTHDSSSSRRNNGSGGGSNRTGIQRHLAYTNRWQLDLRDSRSIVWQSFYNAGPCVRAL